MTNDCCKVLGHVTQEKLDKIISLGFDIYPHNENHNTMRFDMTDEENGYPCLHSDIENSQCLIYDTRPEQCRSFPSTPHRVRNFPNCSYTFDGEDRTGDCNRCQS